MFPLVNAKLTKQAFQQQFTGSNLSTEEEVMKTMVEAQEATVESMQ